MLPLTQRGEIRSSTSKSYYSLSPLRDFQIQLLTLFYNYCLPHCSQFQLLSPGRLAGPFSERKEEAKPGRGQGSDPLEPSPIGEGVKTAIGINHDAHCRHQQFTIESWRHMKHDDGSRLQRVKSGLQPKHDCKFNNEYYYGVIGLWKCITLRVPRIFVCLCLNSYQSEIFT
jgi:hypothetical protein